MSNRIVRRTRNLSAYGSILAPLSFCILTLFVGVGASQGVLLEAQYNGVGMVAPQGKYVYLRVFENGNYEFEDRVVEKGPHKIEVRKETLSPTELRELIEFLNDSSIVGLPKEIPPLSEPLDHVIEIRVEIHRPVGVQKLLVTNYSPNSTRLKNRYPNPLVKLLNAIEKLRKDASFAIASRTAV